MVIEKIKFMLRKRRETREQEVLRALKAQYHTFRAILDNNERALELISDIDTALLKRREPHAPLEELLSVSFELVDGLNRLTGNRYARLYDTHERIARAAREALASRANRSANMPLTIRLCEADAEQAPFIGGKAASLGTMLRAGMPVPDGFAASIRACRIFLSHSEAMGRVRRVLQKLDAGGGDIGEAAATIREIVLHAPLPEALSGALLQRWKELGSPAVSVRSSALVEDRPGQSFAGQFSSYLNIRTPEGLLDAFKRVIASNFGSRPLTYRLHAGLPSGDFDMAVLFQCMVDARGAGVLFTMHPTDPENNRMLVSAVAGLGTQAVGGSNPADSFMPDRDDPENVQISIAVKEAKEIPGAQDGLVLENLAPDERNAPVLDTAEVGALVHWGLFAEVLLGGPQDMEWAVCRDGGLFFLQSRPITLRGKAVRVAARLRGDPLHSGGVCASPGRCFGRAHIIRNKEDLDRGLPDGPVVLVLRQSHVDAARLLPDLEGVVVELGNPTDHLSCVAREYGVPMLTGASSAVESIPADALVILDADEHLVAQAPEAFAQDLPRRRRHRGLEPELSPAASAIRELIVPLNLTDAYGPTFSILECSSLHDIVRFVHEKALISLFETEDAVLEQAESLIKWLEDMPLHFLIIDLGGGLAPDLGRKISASDVRSVPLLTLCEGMATPGLRWREAPPGGSAAGVLSKSLLANAGERPVGSQNYALVSRDYLNLNARVDFHFAMVDSVCGPNRAENYIRFRFKGGGTSALQRNRRAAFISIILQSNGFFTDTRGDLVTGFTSEQPQETIQTGLMMLGRLLGFSRLMDAAMTSDEAPQQVAQAFLEENWSLRGMDFQA